MNLQTMQTDIIELQKKIAILEAKIEQLEKQKKPYSK